MYLNIMTPVCHHPLWKAKFTGLFAVCTQTASPPHETIPIHSVNYTVKQINLLYNTENKISMGNTTS